MAGLEPASYWQKFRDWTFSSGPAVFLEQKLSGGQTAAINATEAVKEVAGDVAAGVTFGAKYGLIIFFVILAFFVMAQAKSLTAVFKE